MIKTRVLITGVSGFVGSHLLEHLLIKTDWDIVGIASWKHKGTPERVESVVKDAWKHRVTIITHDLNAPLTERTIKRLGKIDYIFNVASDSHVDRSIEDPVPFIQNNVNLALNMLELARKIKPKVFMQISTDEVYGQAPKGHNHKEWEPIIPSNPYSASKAAQEAIAISYWRTYGVPVVITNTENNFGETQDSEKYLAKLIKYIEKGETITIHGKKGKIGSRFYMHARNHADALLYIVKNLPPTIYKDVDGVIPDRYNVVGATEMDNLSLAKLVASIMGKPLRYKMTDYHATRPGHDRRYALDGSKLRKLGWKEPIPFKSSLIKYISWTREHPEWF